jgi:short-subunit dehydrogenase
MDRIAVVTGGSSGIGLALAREFAADGHDLVLVSEQEAELEAAATRIRRDHAVEVVPLTQDLTMDDAAERVLAEVRAMGGTVEALVNDAGVGRRGRFIDIPIEQDRYLIRLNLEALTRLTKLFLPAMVARGGGRILNLGSIAGFQPGPLLAVYHATKAYVVSLSEALAEELKDTGVTVTCLCPGPTATDFFDRAEMEDTKVVQKGDLMDPDEVARVGYAAMQRGERLVIPGAINKVMTFTRRMIPVSLQAKVNKQLYEQAEEAPAT